MTLAECMEVRRLPIAEVVHLGLKLAATLRRLHDDGGAHGALTPEYIEVTDTGVELRPSSDGATIRVTPYTAPEVAQGQPPDCRSDIFAFGAIVFEMATGRRPFEDEATPPVTVGHPRAGQRSAAMPGARSRGAHSSYSQRNDGAETI